MSKELKILILEDNPHDKELIERELKKGGLVFTSKGVNNKKDFIESIAEFEPDIVLSDYSLPDLNAIKSIGIVKEKAPLTPIVVVTGSVSEEVAAECIKIGASDYVLKEHLVRLVPAVKNALEKRQAAEDRKAYLDALLKSEERYRKLFNNMLNGFALYKIVLNEDGKPIDYVFLEVNKKFEELTGLKSKDIINKKVTEVLPGIEKHPDDWIGRYGEVAFEGKEVWFEQYSEEIKKWFSIAVFSPESGYFATIFEDITGRKKSEEAKGKTLEELQKFKDVTIGRELQMIELKKEINKLSKDLGREEPYDVEFGE